MSESNNAVCVKVLEGHTRYVNTCGFSPDGLLIATGNFEYYIFPSRVFKNKTVSLRKREVGQIIIFFIYYGKYSDKCRIFKYIKLFNSSYETGRGGNQPETASI